MTKARSREKLSRTEEKKLLINAIKQKKQKPEGILESLEKKKLRIKGQKEKGYDCGYTENQVASQFFFQVRNCALKNLLAGF